MDDASNEYYRRRPAQGEVYGPPEIQQDFKWVTRWLQENVEERDVLEVACGAGHWTRVASATARRIVASDIHGNLVQTARQTVEHGVVDFLVADAYKLPVTPNTFNCGMAHFWLSHVPRPDVRAFVNSFAGHLKRRSRMLFIDSKWVEGYRSPIVRRDQDGNTYQLRTLKDGSQYEILKNYYTEAELVGLLEPFGPVQIQELTYVWAISLELGDRLHRGKTYE